jgi:hypothetical protein
MLASVLIALAVLGTAAGRAVAEEAAAPVPARPEDVAAVERARTELMMQIEKTLTDCDRPHPAVTSPGAAPKDSGSEDKPAHLLKSVSGDYYPYAEIGAGHQAILMMSYLVDALGNPRFAHVERMVASDMKASGFPTTATRMVREATFAPAIRGGTAVASWKRMKIRFVAEEQGRMGNILSEKKLHEFVASARKGDATAQHVVAYLDSIAPDEVGIPAAEERHYVAHAAAWGERTAQEQIARMLGSSTCTLPTSVQEYLKFLAWRGHSDLELIHAGRLLEGADPTAYHDAGPLLHGAANSRDPFMQLWAAGLLATTPIAEVRDPDFALQVAQGLKTVGDPDYSELLAAAQAATGHFEEAVKAEEKAISQAKSMQWHLDLFQQRLAKYKAREPWVGYLCDCTKLVPGDVF